MIGTREIDGHEALTLAGADGNLEASYVPGAGMICCSLKHRGEEILGQRHGLSGYVENRSTMGIPLLYPWANRLSGDRFEVAGKTVDLRETGLVKRDGNGLPIHGLLTAYTGWSVMRHETTPGGATLEAELDWAADPELMRSYPFPHRLTIKASITSAALEITTTIGAEQGPVPIAFGYHPYLAPPEAPRERWELDLPLGDHLVLDDRGLPNGEREPTTTIRGPLGERSFDDLYLAPRPEAALTVSSEGRSIEIVPGSGYPFTQIYAPAGEALIAVEPMAAVTDALSDPQALAVAAGRSWSARFALRIRSA